MNLPVNGVGQYDTGVKRPPAAGALAILGRYSQFEHAGDSALHAKAGRPSVPLHTVGFIPHWQKGNYDDVCGSASCYHCEGGSGNPP